MVPDLIPNSCNRSVSRNLLVGFAGPGVPYGHAIASRNLPMMRFLLHQQLQIFLTKAVDNSNIMTKIEEEQMVTK